MKEPKRVLFVNSEIMPYVQQTQQSIIGRYLPQGILEQGKEIRSFMPRYGCINERRNQLHEVIRLSGLNIVVNDVDRPLVIKVASITAARMQVYFIDNEDYFRRKAMYCDADGKFFEDNGQRAVFFARGVLETVKKLRWKPDIIHCNGWLSHLLPLYLKKAYKNDPIFSDSKIILSLYDEDPTFKLESDFKSNILMPGVKNKDVDKLEQANGINLARLAIQYSDGIIYGSNNLHPEIEKAIADSALPVLSYKEIGLEEKEYVIGYNRFFDSIIGTDE